MDPVSSQVSLNVEEEERRRGAETAAAEEGPSSWSCGHTAQSPEELQQGGKWGTKKYFALLDSPSYNDFHFFIHAASN